jgi:hypothetical protein
MAIAVGTTRRHLPTASRPLRSQAERHQRSATPGFRLFDVATRERLSDSEALLREPQKGLATRADELPEDAGGLRWIGDGLPVGQRHRGADSSVYLCHQGGTAEHAHASLLHEPTQRGDIICRGVADDAVSCGVSVVSLALRRHAS